MKKEMKITYFIYRLYHSEYEIETKVAMVRRYMIEEEILDYLTRVHPYNPVELLDKKYFTMDY